MNKFINVSFIVCIFLPLSQISLSFIDLYYYYVFVIILFPVLVIKYRTIDSGLFLVLLVLLLLGLFNVVLGNNDIFSFIKVFAGVVVFYAFYYYILKSKRFDFVPLFKLYFKCSVATALIGFVQFFSYLVGFKFGYDLSWLGLRVIAPGELGGSLMYPIHSITSEPAAYAMLLSPAMYMSMMKFTNRELPFPISKLNAVLIISSFILTQSSTGFFSIFVALTLANLNHINIKRIFMAGSTLITSFAILYQISIKFQDRVDSSIGLLTGEIIADAIQGPKAHGSSLILFNHFVIAKKNAYDHPFGTGLGSHHLAFNKYNTLRTWFTGYDNDSTALNLHDANSLFSRILSEMGYLGVIFALIFLVKFFLVNGPAYLIIINHASLVAILTAMLRQGHYFIFGLPFFILCYYYSNNFSKNEYSKKNNTIDVNKAYL